MHTQCKKCLRRIHPFDRLSYKLPCDIEHPSDCLRSIQYPVAEYDHDKKILEGKLTGKICSECGKEDVWLTDYINLNAPNVECHSCGRKWIESPETKLHILLKK